jgi:2-keto-4-pentenoate hydratase
MLTDRQRSEAASQLAEAERSATPVPQLTSEWPEMNVTDAYEIQLLNIRRRVADGAVIRGHKVGLSSPAMQQMMGVDEPDYGHLLDDMFVFENDEVATSSLCYPRVEMEVAFVLDEGLPGGTCTAADVLRCTRFLMPAIEIIDSRIANWNIGLLDTIADNASSCRVVLGGTATPIDQVDIRTIGAAMERNGEIVETGSAAAVLGNPVTAVAWLANKVHAFGVTLERGHVILPGACARAVDVHPGDNITCHFSTLGPVGVRFS